MARQVALQWPGEIPKPRSLDCSVTPSDSMKWRPPADHGQKHETGDWIHFALDDWGPITEAEPSTTITMSMWGLINHGLQEVSEYRPVQGW
jgi:hypothetical protein